MISDQEKLVVLLKYQPYITKSDVDFYAEAYNGVWAYEPVPYKEDGTNYTFLEYVDWLEELDYHG